MFCKCYGFISTYFYWYRTSYSCATPPKPPQDPEPNRGRRIIIIRMIRKITNEPPKQPPPPDTATLSSNDILHAPFNFKLICLIFTVHIIHMVL